MVEEWSEVGWSGSRVRRAGGLVESQFIDQIDFETGTAPVKRNFKNGKN